MEGSEAAQMRVYWGEYFIRAKETIGVDVSWNGGKNQIKKNARQPFLCLNHYNYYYFRNDYIVRV